MAIEDKIQERMAARRNAMMAERLSRMADRPMRTPDTALTVPRRPIGVGGTTRPVAPDLEVPFLPKDVGGNAGGMGIAGLANALTIRRPQMPEYAMPQPGQSYGSWLSSQIRGGVDFGSVDPRAVYNQGSDRPLPNVAPAAPMVPQAPTPFGGKGGQSIAQMPTQPGGKGAANPAMGAGLSALGLFR